ncbi:HAMP domain-containing protein, partial [Rhizobium sp.]|uniref:HAMP domain-containing protein n=1 Tax=Rhizobium sp. TaxID=391 RepID=UPI000E8635F4|nr:hypothetical protein [Rhizobium sp.]
MLPFTIKTALTLTLSIIIACIIALSALSFHGLTGVYANLEDIGGPLLKRQAMAGAIKTEFVGLRLTVAKASAAKTNPDALRKALAAQKIQAEKLTSMISDYKAIARTGTGKVLVDKIASSVAAYIDVSNTLAALWLDGKNAEAHAIADAKIVGVSSSANESVDTLLKYIDTRVADTVVASAEKKATVTYLMIAMSLLSGVVALGGMVFVIRSVANPIGKLAESMRRLADGDLNSTVPFADRKDELGDMAGAVEVFRNAGLANKRLEAEAADTRRLQEETTQHQSRHSAV